MLKRLLVSLSRHHQPLHSSYTCNVKVTVEMMMVRMMLELNCGSCHVNEKK